MGVSANDANVVYVVEAAGGIFGGLYKSTDSGATFVELDHTGNNYFGYDSNAGDGLGQAPRDMDIAVNPSDANDVTIAGINSWRSTNGGTTFNITSQWVPGTAAGLNIGYCHADIDILEYVGNRLFVGSDGGIFVANDPTNVNSNYYTDLSTGLGIKQFYRIGVSQTDPVVVTGGSQDNGSSVLANGTWSDWLGADGMEGFVDKNNPNTIYGTSQNGSLYRSLNQGAGVQNLPSPEGKSGNWITPFEQDPITDNVVYSGYDEIYKSEDGGLSWSSVSQNFGSNVDHLKIAPSNNLTMYVADGTSLYKNTFVGILPNWTQVTGFAGSINSIAIHPTDPNKVAIATTSSQKVYVTTNGGTSWTSYLYDLPNFSARALAWANNGDNGLYLGMNYGVYYIDDTTGNSWVPFSNGLPNVIISELEINHVEGKLYAATYGRGLWRTDIYNPLSVAEFELNSLQLSPNPAKDVVTLSWDKADEVSVRVFNSLGKLLYYSKKETLLNPKDLDISGYASGLYFVKINNSKGEITKKLIVK